MIFSLFAALESGPVAMLISTAIVLALLAFGLHMLRRYSPVSAKIVRKTIGGILKLAGIAEGLEFEIKPPYSVPPPRL